MNVLILMGSPRLQGNTAELCKPFRQELLRQGCTVHYVTLADKHIAPCKGCYACQQVSGSYGCSQQDDMQAIVAEIQWAELIVLATPIYAWYCAAPMKHVLDRHYGLNKYYGSAEGSLWAGKQVAILATHGYDRDYATEPFALGVERLCKHSQLGYLGLYSVQDEDDLASFQTSQAVEGARAFARQLLERMPQTTEMGGTGR